MSRVVLREPLLTPPNACYHCGQEVPASVSFQVDVLGESRAMCCPGCQAVAQTIVLHGLESYYQYRTELPQEPAKIVPDKLQRLLLYDEPTVQREFVVHQASGYSQVVLILEGVTCAACLWLVERHLRQLGGVHEVVSNYTAHRVHVCWDAQHSKLSTILQEVSKLGYTAHLFSMQQQDQMRKKRRDLDIRRIAVAAALSAQVMMFAVALYAGAYQGMESMVVQLFRWLSLLLSVPVLLYAALPFYVSAWYAIRSGRFNMDVPVSLGLVAGFFGSLWNTVVGSGAVYYDTITMLVFFLLGTRFLERKMGEKSVLAVENLLRVIPAVALRINGTQQQLVSVAELACGDRVLMRPGEVFPVDGIVEQGTSSTDEAILTGESRVLPKGIGDVVYAGTTNHEGSLQVRVTHVKGTTILDGIVGLLDRAQASRPVLSRLADRIAVWFTTTQLVLVILVAAGWWWLEPQRAFAVTLSVLLISCPCALSIAAPAAFAASGANFLRRGLLFKEGQVLENLSRTTHMVFDKTGTLTLGRPKLVEIWTNVGVTQEAALQIAAALEQASEHPLAHSFLEEAGQVALPQVSHRQNIPGIGVGGEIDGVLYNLGNRQSYRHLLLETPLPDALRADGASAVWLSDCQRVLACFQFVDELRPGAIELVLGLQQTYGIKVSLYSGDHRAAVVHQARKLGITDWQAELLPEEKLQALRQLQSQQAIVAWVGDGINDTPALAGANVSVAMGNGSHMVRALGDLVLMTEQLQGIQHAVHMSRLTMRVIRQSFFWALGYNLLAVPLAVTGYIAPWLAALGMSLSSLIVMLNVVRLWR